MKSSSIGTTAHCGLWPFKHCSPIFSYLPPTLSNFSLPPLEDLLYFPLLLLTLALQPTVSFGLSNNVLPFSPICHQLSPSSHFLHLKISFCFLFPCTFNVARVISVYPVFFRPSSFNLSSFFLCSIFITISFFTGWGC